LELRATTSLAELLRVRGRVEEAQERLFAVLDWFNEGFDTADLRQAKELLESLSRPRQS
jgi:adenylate cyclase